MWEPRETEAGQQQFDVAPSGAVDVTRKTAGGATVRVVRVGPAAPK